MRARPREINIFNMSLLDILCGALGAFCFMMLVALPYYKSTGDAKQNEQDILVILQEIDVLIQGVTDRGKAEDLRGLVERLRARIQELQGERNHLAYENTQLRTDLETANKAVTLLNDKLDEAEAEADRLEEEARQAKMELAVKKPFAVMAVSSEPKAVDLYLERTQFIIMGSRFERFNPAEPVHRSPVPDDLNAWALVKGATFWVNAEARPGNAYRVFVKSFGPPETEATTTVKLEFIGDFGAQKPTATVAFNQARPWVLAGTVAIDNAGKLSFQEANDAERDEAWRQRMKSEPPPAPIPDGRAPDRPPRSGPPDSTKKAPMTQEEAAKAREEYLKKRGFVPPEQRGETSATPAPQERKVDREELRQRSERARREAEEKIQRERAAQSPAPAASPSPP